MLRKEILIQSEDFDFKQNYKDYKPADIDKMNALIGDKSFSLEDAIKGKIQNFGAVKSISPVFITDPANSFIPAPLDHELEFHREKGVSAAHGYHDFIPELRGYDPKGANPESLVSSDSSPALKMDEIFIPSVKIGINKDRTDTDEGQFFKHRFYRLKQGFSFAFIARLEFPQKLENTVVTLGGENASFSMEIEEVSTDFTDIFTFPTSPDKLTLLGDAMVPAGIYNQCDFALTRTRDFRNIQTRSGDYTYRRRKFNSQSKTNDDKQKQSKSPKFTFLKRGSVFFTHNRPALESLIANPGLSAIGYNIFI